MGDVFVGPPIDDWDILTRLPSALAETLRMKNGFVSDDSAIHVRGACNEPEWHSLRYAWDGPHSLHELFPSVQVTDIPIAEDCFGDQYLLRDHLTSERQRGKAESWKFCQWDGTSSLLTPKDHL
jgi:hypothetical protein